MTSVLYVDDEPDLLDISRCYLEKTQGFTVDTVESAHAALEKIRTISYDVIVSDYQMPEMDGIQLLKALRASGNSTPFIIFTGKGREEVVIQAFENGADFYVQKGGEPKSQFTELSHKIKKAVEGRQAGEALKESERKFRTIFENSPYPICINSIPDGRFIEVNTSFLQSSGYSEAEILGKNPVEMGLLSHSDFGKLVMHMLAAGRLENVPMVLVGKGGDKIHVQFSTIPVTIHDRPAIMTMTAEITRLKRIEEELHQKNEELAAAIRELTGNEEALRRNYDQLAAFQNTIQESEARFRTLFAISPDGIILFDLTGRITFVSPEVLKIFGFSSHDEAIGTTVFDWVDPEYHELLRNAMMQLLDGKIQRAITYRARRRDGSSFFVEASQGIVPDARSNPGGFMVIIRDITDHRQAEMKLQESEENFRKIFESSALGMTLTMPDLRFLLVNPAWLTMTGYTEEELRTMSFRDITHPDDIQRNSEGIEALVEGRIPVYSTEKRYIRKDGSILWGALNVSAVRNSRGKPRYCLAQIEDITPRKLVEEALRESEEKLALVMNGVPTLISYLDKELRFVYINKAQREWFGIEERNLIGRSLKDFLPEDAFLRALPYYQQVLGGQEVIFENPTKDRDGRERVLIVRLVPHIHSGQVAGFFAALEDITERKDTERAFQAMVRSMVGATGLNSPHKIAESISSWLGADCVIVGEIQPDKKTVRALSMVLDGEDITDYSYILKGSPCGNVVEGGFCIYPDNVVRLFPDNKVLVELDIRGYIGTPLRNSNGEVIGVLCVLSRSPLKPSPVMHEILDVIAVKAAAEIERSRIMAALQESEETYRLLAEQVHDGIYIYQGTRFVFVNSLVSRISGYSKDELLAMDFIDLVHPDDRAFVEGITERRRRGEQVPHIYETRIVQKDGSVRHVELAVSVIPFKGSNLVLGAARDITDQKKAVDALRESEEKYRILIENAQDVVLRITIDGILTYCSPAVTKFGGYVAEEEIGQHIGKYFASPDQFGQALTLISELTEKRESSSLEFIYQPRDRPPFWVEVVGSPVIEENRVTAIQCIMRDITGRKQGEEALREANIKLHLLSAITRHDINNQLTVLQTYLPVLEEQFSDPPSCDYFRRVEKATERISAMIQFTKTCESIGSNAPVWQDLLTIVETAAKEVVLGHIRLTHDLPPGIEICTDPLIVRVFSNLIDNSVRYGGTITTIRFFGEKHEGPYLIVCEDDGVGIPERLKERIFERGFGKNTGLGLFLAREILSITGITIRETGEPGKGARFEIIVPKLMYRFTTLPLTQLPERS